MQSEDIEYSTGAQAALAGYRYQLRVSVLFALDVLAKRQEADQITLEPANREDLETELKDEPGALTQRLTITTRKLVVQCKLRNTGPWTIREIKSLLVHGRKRTPPKDLLKDPDVSYLLVTSADLSRDARELRVDGPTRWQRLGPMPSGLSKVLPKGADGRVAVWRNLDPERIEYRIKDRLTEWFHVPQSRIEACIGELEEGALLRMSGSQAGVWKREDVVAIIEAHEGYDGTARDLARFVRPGNWNELVAQLESRNAIVLTGPSGTGKTTTAKALIAFMRKKRPQLTPVKIVGGPERLRDDSTTGPVIFEIEDPWGKYRAEPESLPWNDMINGFLGSASPERMFVITSRSDVMQDANIRSLDQRYKATLLADHYRASDRQQLFDHRLGRLRRAEQRAAHRYRFTVIRELALPLELDRFFGAAALGPNEDESEPGFMRRCIDEARSQSIESGLTLVVARQEKWDAAAILWAMLKARKRLTFNVLEELEEEMSRIDPGLEDRLSTLANTLIAGGNLRQDKSEFSCAHPRVEAGLEKALLEKRAASARVLGRLPDALVALDGVSRTDWGTETAALVIAAMSSVSGLKRRIATSTQEHVDTWLTQRLASLDDTFPEDLALAAKVGSDECDVAELARWLDESSVDEEWFDLTSWKEPEKPPEWYERLSRATHTFAICDAFITRVVGFRRGWFDCTFHEAIAKLSPDLTRSFRAALGKVVAHGYNPGAETLIRGAIVDLDSYEEVFDNTTAHLGSKRNTRDRSALLALYNRNYDNEAQDYYWESMGEEGYTASEILQAYIEERRKRGEWQALTERPNQNGYLWEWINAAQKSERAPPVEELVALGRVSSDSRYEDDYWELVAKHFDKALMESLRDRLREGSGDDATRASATTVALRHAPDLIGDLFSDGSGVSTQRQLELALDVRACLDDKGTEEWGERPDFDRLIGSAEEATKEAIGCLLGSGDGEVSGAGLALVAGIPKAAPTALNLAVARALWESGHDVVERLKHLLSSTLEVTDENIDLAEQAMKLAASYGDKELVQLGLQHDFAVVRIEAMNALVEKSPGPLPQGVLDKRCDPSSLVRRHLIGMLKARPDPAHIPTLLKLSYDTWTPDDHHQDVTVSYPIAQDAIAILREEQFLGEDIYGELIKSLNSSNNKHVRLQLLRTMARHGSPERKKKLIEFAIGEGRPTLQRLTAQAVYLEVDSIPESQHSLVNDARLAEVSPDVCFWLCLFMSKIAPADRLLHVVQLLATNSNRRVFVGLLYLVCPRHRGDAVGDEIEGFLPEDVVDALKKMQDTGCADDLSCLDELGDVRSVEQVKDGLKVWFKTRG